MSRGYPISNADPKGAEFKENLRRALGLAVALDLPPEDLGPLEAAHGLPEGTLLPVLCSDDGARVAAMEADALGQSGEVLKRKAVDALDKLVGRMEAMIDAGEVSPSAAPKFADVLFKLTGLAEERGAKLRAQGGPVELPFVFTVLYEGEPAPLLKEGQHGLTIHHLGPRPADKQKPNEKVIEGERVDDVTPTRKGGDDAA